MKQSLTGSGEMNQDDLLELITRAAKVIGSERQLALHLGIPPQHISEWKSEKPGTRNAQPEDIALLASIAGLEADKWALRAMIAKHEGTAKGDRLLKALGKGLLATGAVIGSAGVHATAIFSRAGETTLTTWSDVLRCIELLTRRQHQCEPAAAGFFSPGRHHKQRCSFLQLALHPSHFTHSHYTP